MTIRPQLNFGGDCQAAFRFYEQHLGGTITMMMKQSDVPGAPASAGDDVVHASMEIAGITLTGNDVPPEVFRPIRSVYFILDLESPAEAERIHGLLADRGEVTMPMAETFFATRFSQLRDRFGVLWSIMHQRPMQG